LAIVRIITVKFTVPIENQMTDIHITNGLRNFIYTLSKSSTKRNNTFEKLTKLKQCIFNVKQCSTRKVVSLLMGVVL